MATEAFVSQKFNTKSLEMVERCNGVIRRYQGMGYDLTLRQLYYQCVSQNWIPNSEKSYKSLGDLISKARLAGLIDWDAIKDRTRSVQAVSHWERPADVIESAAQAFRIDKWEDQPNFVMVMVEKQALEGVLIPVCRQLDIQFSANRGYSSSSALYELGQNLSYERSNGKDIHILYLGDHDPSGIDMTRDVGDRLCLFSYGPVYVKRLALNMDQIEQYGPPENPAKIADPRAVDYIARFGESSWELDALQPEVLADLVTMAVEELRDTELYERRERMEEEMRKDLRDYAKTNKDKTYDIEDY